MTLQDSGEKKKKQMSSNQQTKSKIKVKDKSERVRAAPHSGMTNILQYIHTHTINTKGLFTGLIEFCYVDLYGEDSFD